MCARETSWKRIETEWIWKVIHGKRIDTERMGLEMKRGEKIMEEESNRKNELVATRIGSTVVRERLF